MGPSSGLAVEDHEGGGNVGEDDLRRVGPVLLGRRAVGGGGAQSGVHVGERQREVPARGGALDGLPHLGDLVGGVVGEAHPGDLEAAHRERGARLVGVHRGGEPEHAEDRLLGARGDRRRGASVEPAGAEAVDLGLVDGHGAGGRRRGAGPRRLGCCLGGHKGHPDKGQAESMYSHDTATPYAPAVFTWRKMMKARDRMSGALVFPAFQPSSRYRRAEIPRISTTMTTMAMIVHSIDASENDRERDCPYSAYVCGPQLFLRIVAASTR